MFNFSFCGDFTAFLHIFFILSFFHAIQPTYIGHHYSLITFLSSTPPHYFLLFTPIWFICSLCLLPLSALTSVIRCRIELRSPLINSSLDRSWQPQAEAAEFLVVESKKVDLLKYTVLKYNLDVLILCFHFLLFYTSATLHFNGKYCTFHSFTFIWQL